MYAYLLCQGGFFLQKRRFMVLAIWYARMDYWYS